MYEGHSTVTDNEEINNAVRLKDGGIVGVTVGEGDGLRVGNGLGERVGEGVGQAGTAQLQVQEQFGEDGSESALVPIS